MKLIYIYGSPAVGKLTVAKQIAKRTGFKIFHNHLSVDAILPIFEFGSPSFDRLNSAIRQMVITEAVQQNVDLVSTYCYARGFDDEMVEELMKAVESKGGEVKLVLLTCRREELEQRVVAESRGQFGKIRTVEMLTGILSKYELDCPLPNRESLVIDNTNLLPDKVAEAIIAHYAAE